MQTQVPLLQRKELPAQSSARNEAGRGKLALQLEFLFMLLSRGKKTHTHTNSGAIVASVPYKSGQLTGSQGEVIRTQPLFHKALSPKTLPYGPVLQPLLTPA